jgi:protein ImuB
MARVASLWLPLLPVERLWRAERPARPPEPVPHLAQAAAGDPPPGPALRAGGWRPGAYWAREGALGGEARQRPARYGSAAAAAMILIERRGQREQITALCPHAFDLGLRRGMAAAHARALVPDLDVREADAEGDAAALHRLALHALAHWTPVAAASGVDGLWLDLSGCTHLFGGEERFCARLIRFCARLGYSAAISIAGTPGAAYALARYGGRAVIILPEGEESAALAPLPLVALRLPPEALSAAARFGLERIGDLYPMPRGPLARRLGLGAVQRLDQARGQTAEPIVPVVVPQSPYAERQLLEPIGTAEAIAAVIADLVAELVRLLQARGEGARALVLACVRVDGDVQRIAIGTARPSRDEAHLGRLLAMRIERIDPGLGIESMRIDVPRTDPLAPEPIGGIGLEAAPVDVAPLVDRLAGRIGEAGVFAITAQESDVPERAAWLASALVV